MKRVVVVAVALLVGLALAQEPIRIGVNLELSGRFASIGQEQLRGIELAAELAGEVLGRPVELSICDNETSREGSAACAQRFVNEGVVAVLGTFATSQSLPAAEILQPAGIVMVSTGSTNPQTTQIGDYIFRIPFTDDFQGVVGARYVVNDLGAQRIAIFRQTDDDYSFGLAELFDAEARRLGVETMFQDFVANTVDFTSQLGNIRPFNPDAIYYSGFCPEGAPFMIQLRQQGFEQPVVGADAIDDVQCPEGGGVAFNGVLLTGFADSNILADPDAIARAEEFGEAFRSAYGTTGSVTGLALAGADAFNVVAAAIEAAGSTDRAAVQAALAGLENFPGVSGPITFAGTDGTPSDRTIGFFEYRVEVDGSWDKVGMFGLSTLE
jgi:branched-chain amino acid transport system substrate-binding protein